VLIFALAASYFCSFRALMPLARFLKAFFRESPEKQNRLIKTAEFDKSLAGS